MSKGKLSNNELDSGLCVLVYAANLAQSPVQELTNSGIDILIHNQANHDQSLTRKMRTEITSFMLALSEKYSTLHCAEKEHRHLPDYVVVDFPTFHLGTQTTKR